MESNSSYNLTNNPNHHLNELIESINAIDPPIGESSNKNSSINIIVQDLIKKINNSHPEVFTDKKLLTAVKNLHSRLKSNNTDAELLERINEIAHKDFKIDKLFNDNTMKIEK